MVDHGYGKTNADPCVFMKTFADGEFVILLLYMDNMLIISQDAEKIHSLKGELRKSFAMKDLGPTKQILGIRITLTRRTENTDYRRRDIYPEGAGEIQHEQVKAS